MDESLDISNEAWQANNVVNKVVGRTFPLDGQQMTFGRDRKRLARFVMQQLNRTLGAHEVRARYNFISSSGKLYCIEYTVWIA